MARVTVEDCILSIPNRFDLVITAAQRAKQISSGMPLTIDRDNDKDSVVSLREIAEFREASAAVAAFRRLGNESTDHLLQVRYECRWHAVRRLPK